MTRLRKLSLVFLPVTLFLAACAGPAATPAPAPATAPAATEAAPTMAPTAVAPTATPAPTVLDYLDSPALDEPDDLLDLALSRAKAGEITYEQALIQALKLYAGEAGALAVPEDAEFHGEGNSLYGLARQYLATGADAAAKAEIERLLNVIAPSPERLLAYAEPEPASGFGKAPGLARAAAQGDDAKCRELWAEGFPPGSAVTCLLYASAPLSGGEARVFYPKTWGQNAPQTTMARYAMEAVLDSDAVYSRFGRMKSVNVVFTLLANPDNQKVLGMTPWNWNGDGNTCPVILYPAAILNGQAEGVEIFKQTVAHELFHCFQAWNMPSHTPENYSGTAWWVEGSAEYFSNLVYPAANDEWDRIADFDKNSANTPLYQLRYETTVFWQYLGNQIGDAALVELLKSLPGTPDPKVSGQALAARPDMQALWHSFAQAWADRAIADTGGGFLPNQTVITPDAKRKAEGNATWPMQAELLVLRRYQLTFTGKGVFAVTHSAAGAAGAASSRVDGARGDWADLPNEINTGCGEASFVYVVTTATSAGAAHQRELNVQRVREEPCAEEGAVNFGKRGGQTACDHPFMPLRPGATWTYSGGGRTVTWTVTDVAGDQQQASAAMTAEGGKVTSHFLWECEAGVGLQRLYRSQTIDGAGTLDLTLDIGFGAYLPPAGALKPDLAWEASAKYFETGGGGGGMDVTDKMQIVSVTDDKLVVAHQGVTNIAFAFAGRVFRLKPQTVDETLTFVAGVGLVEFGDAKLTSHSVP